MNRFDNDPKGSSYDSFDSGSRRGVSHVRIGMFSPGFRRRMNPLLIALLVILAGAAILFFSLRKSSAPQPSPAPAAPSAPATQEPAPATQEPAPAEPTAGEEYHGITFSTADRNGNGWDQRVFADYDLVMINFFEPWCGPCVGEMPELERLYQDYKDKGVLLIGVYSTEDGVEDVLAQTGVTYPILKYCPDFDRFQTGYVPSTIFVNSAGELVGETQIGSNSYEGWAALLDSLL